MWKCGQLQSRLKEGGKKIRIEERRNKEGMNGHKGKERINDERKDRKNKKGGKYRRNRRKEKKTKKQEIIKNEKGTRKE